MDGWRSHRCYQFAGGLLAMLAVAVSSGCTVIRNEFRTLIAEPIKFGDNIDIIRTRKRNKQLAKEAFEQFESNHAETPPSPDYRDGFIKGFADYLTFGGKGAPPVVPPRRYWNLPDRSPAGRTAVQDWFAGFAAGASEAKLSGLREQQTVLSSYVPVDEFVDSPTSEHAEGTPHINQHWETLPPPSNSLRSEAATPPEPPLQLPLLVPSEADREEPRDDSEAPEPDTTQDAQFSPPPTPEHTPVPSQPETLPQPSDHKGHELPELEVSPTPGTGPADSGMSPEDLRSDSPTSSRRTHRQDQSAKQTSAGGFSPLFGGRVRQASHSESATGWIITISDTENSEQSPIPPPSRDEPTALPQYDTDGVGNRITLNVPSYFIERLPPVDDLPRDYPKTSSAESPP